MSNPEHLIENALTILFKNPNAYKMNSYDEFATQQNIEIAEQIGVKLQDVWEMAFYVWLHYIPSCGNFVDADLIKLGVQRKIDMEKSERHDTCMTDLALSIGKINAYEEIIEMIDGGKYIL